MIPELVGCRRWGHTRAITRQDSIINSHSCNMPNFWMERTDMQMALERCATINEFEYMLN